MYLWSLAHLIENTKFEFIIHFNKFLSKGNIQPLVDTVQYLGGTMKKTKISGKKKRQKQTSKKTQKEGSLRDETRKGTQVKITFENQRLLF